MSAIPLWVHCNICTSRDMSSLLMTSCGKVICCRCRPSLATSTCQECRGPCSRVIRLQDAPREVRVLFKDVSQQLKIVMKMVTFEDLQRRNVLNHSQEKLQRLKQRSIQDRQDLLELIAAKDKMAQNVRRLERNIARKKEEREKVLNRDNERGPPTFTPIAPKSGKVTPSRPPVYRGCGSFSTMSEYLRTPPAQLARGNPSPITPARRRPQQGTEGDRTPAEREKFLTMKTPAAWHKYQQQYSGRNNHDVGNKRTPPQLPPRKERGLEEVIKFFSPSPSPSPHS